VKRPTAFAGLLALASCATALVAAWLLVVSVTILPSRDPTHVGMWRILSVALLIYAGLCGARAMGVRHAALRALVVMLSMAATAFGVYAITWPRSEGYLLLMGVILCGHAVIAVAHEIRTTVAHPPVSAR
jgi:hypothetical protein